MTDIESFKFSLIQKIHSSIEDSEKKLPVLDENKPVEIDELDIDKLVGKVFSGEIVDKSIRLLKNEESASMSFTTYMNKCGRSWMACANKLDKGYLGLEYGSIRKTIFQYIFYGSAKICKVFSDETRIIENKGEIIDVKEYYKQDVIFNFLEDSYIWGFNQLNESDNWDAKLVKEKQIVGTCNSVLVCLDGSPIVNENTLQRFDFDELQENKIYNIDIRDGVLALFKS